jgi:hypothetical protein
VLLVVDDAGSASYEDFYSYDAGLSDPTLADKAPRLVYGGKNVVPRTETTPCTCAAGTYASAAHDNACLPCNSENCEADITPSDPTCSTGVLDDKGEYCCQAVCGKCGGNGNINIGIGIATLMPTCDAHSLWASLAPPLFVETQCCSEETRDYTGRKRRCDEVGPPCEMKSACPNSLQCRQHTAKEELMPKQVLLVLRAPQWPCRVNADTDGVCQELSPQGV